MKSVAKKLCALAVLSASVVFCGTAHGAPILLKARTIEPEKEAAKPRLMATSAASPQAAALPERGLYIVQHDGVITPSWRESLEATGAIVRYYIPENAYLVEASPAAHEAIRNTIPHTYLGEFKGEYRYDASFVSTTVNVAQTVANGAEAISATREFAILLFTEECREAVAKNITAIPGCSISSSSGKVIRAKLTTAAVKDISSWPDVSWMEPFVQARLHNDVAVESSRMNVQTVWPGGTSDLGLTGEGQIVGVADSGFDTGDEDTIHRDVRGRVIKAMGGWYSRPDEWSDLSGHGTHVVGSVLGNGSESDGKIKGVAYNAKLVMQSLGSDSSDNVSYPSDIYELYLEAYGYGAKIHSNSYGGGNDNSYTLSANRTDAFLFDHLDAVILRSAGNDGEDLSPKDGVVDPGSISDFAVSKNAIVVGASEGFRTTGNYAVQSHVWERYKGKYEFPRYPVDPIVHDHVAKPYMAATQGMAAFSSRGPCADGRVKPDIVAPGTGILSLYSTVGNKLSRSDTCYHNDYYRYMQGTSQATPLVAGSAALVREWLQKKRNITNPDGTTIKAILLAGAKSLSPGQYGDGKYREVPGYYPNNVEGWGQANLGNSLQNPIGVLVYDGEAVAHGEVRTFKVDAVNGNALNIVMAYNDAPGHPAAGKALWNDLDLLVTTPTGGEIYPNSRSKGDGPDRLNNVEGIRIAAKDVETGTYTITVTGYSVTTGMPTTVTGGKKYATRYSLVVNGAKEIGSLPDPPPVKKPDLAFTAYGDWPLAAFLSTSDSSSDKSDTFEEGNSIYLFAYFKNVGTADGTDFTVRHKVVNVLSGAVVDSEDRPTAARAVGQGGGWNGLAVPMLQGLPAGTYKWICELDADSVVEESNEDNNRKEVSFTVTKKAVPIPGAPASLNVSAGGDKLTVSWNAVSGAVKYNVYRSTTSSRPSSPLDTVSAATAYSDGNVAIGTTYYYWVAAVNSEGKEGTVAGPKSGTIDLSLTFDDSSTRQFDAKGGTGSVVVTANANWAATVDKSWVRLGVQNGGEGKTTLRFSVDATGETSDRSATITVSAGGGTAQKTLAVSQKGIQANSALGKALDSTGLSFFTGGDSEWVDVSLDDTFATAGTYVRSGALAYGQTGWIETIVSGSGTLQFRYGVSGMAAGTFALIVDGSEVATFATILGQWKYGSYNITSSGSHRIRWEYRQNGNATLSGTSYAMLDDVSFGAVARARPAENVSASSGASGITLNWTLTGGDVSSFNVWRATSLKAAQREKIKTMSASGNGIVDQFSCTDGTCQQGITYYYWIESVNASGSAVSEAVSGQIEGVLCKLAVTELALPAYVPNYKTNVFYTANIKIYPKSNVSWLSVSGSALQGTDRELSMTFKNSNRDADARYATVTIFDASSGGNVLATLTVVQEGMPRNPVSLKWYVNGSNGNDENDGASPTSAKKTIQAAVDAALSGDEIIVEDGTYAGFSVESKIDLAIRSVNGPAKTIIDGNGTAPVVSVSDSTDILTGFTVQGGNGTFARGAGINGGSWNRCVIRNNVSGYRGGGVLGATLYNCLVTGNESASGGGVFGATLYNCTVVGNHATSEGGGVYGCKVYNSIIWGNTSDGESPDIYYTSAAETMFCCVSTLPDAGDGNIAVDPRVSVSGGGCTVEGSSPCINAGSMEYVYGESDLVGNPRIGNGVVDIGAIEDLTVAPASPAASIRAAQTGSITIDIQATSRATEYVVYRSVSSSPRPGQAHATVNATANAATAYIDNDDVLPGVEYWYWIAAKNEAGESAAVLIGKGYRVPSLSLNGSPLQFSSDGGTLSVGITTDAGWTAFVRDDWASVSPSAGDGNGQIAVSAIRNEKMVSHDTILSVVAGFGTAHPVTNTLSVVQSAAPAPVYRASFDANGGQGDMGVLDFQDGAEQALSPCGFTRTGYAFAGWSFEPDGEAFYSDGETVTLQKNATLYAVWTPVAYTVVFHSNDGTSKSVRQEFVYDAEQALTANSFVVVGGEFMGWAVEENGGVVYQDKQDVVNLTAEADGEVSLYAVWRAKTVAAVAAPVVSPPDGTYFTDDSCTVTLSCATPGATIYYSPKGVTPRITSAYQYTGPFTIADTATIKAVAVLDGVKSEYVTATITKRALTLAEAAGAPDLAFTTGGDAEWTPEIDATSPDGYSAQSGTIGDAVGAPYATSWLQTVVSGAGTISFRWKVVCEWDDSGAMSWDRAVFFTNGVEAARMDGTSGWKEISFTFADAGSHALRWQFQKDDYNEEEFADHAWVSGIVWTPRGESPTEPIPPLPTTATDSEVAAALAGSGDANLLAAVTTAAQYVAYRTWALSVTNDVLSAQNVKDSAHTWLSYALGADRLVTKELANGDVTIESFSSVPGADGFRFEVSIQDVNIGGGFVEAETLKANMGTVFGVEGSATLRPAAFSSDGIDITFDVPQNGKARFTATPPSSVGDTYFMRVKVK